MADGIITANTANETPEYMDDVTCLIPELHGTLSAINCALFCVLGDMRRGVPLTDAQSSVLNGVCDALADQIEKLRKAKELI